MRQPITDRPHIYVDISPSPIVNKASVFLRYSMSSKNEAEHYMKLVTITPATCTAHTAVNTHKS